MWGLELRALDLGSSIWGFDSKSAEVKSLPEEPLWVLDHVSGGTSLLFPTNVGLLGSGGV